MRSSGQEFQNSGDEDPIKKRQGRSGSTQSFKRPPPPIICFNRKELTQILQVYGMRVAKGEWRDYALNTYKDRAVFSIFRKSSEVPLYRIEKNIRFAKKQGAYRIITPTGLILKRGHDLDAVLRAIKPKPKLALV